MPVVGVDGYRRGWVAVELGGTTFLRARVFATIADVAAAFPDAYVIAVDIPIGLPDHGTRAADVAARTFLGRRASSVFTTPTRAAIEAPDYAAARRLQPSTSAQAYALRKRILEVDELAARDARFYEVHPEVSFRALAGSVLPPKKTWNGVHERRAALAATGIVLPGDLAEAGFAPPDDVLDAAVAAWTAERIAQGRAGTLPAEDRRRIGPIWF